MYYEEQNAKQAAYANDIAQGAISNGSLNQGTQLRQPLVSDALLTELSKLLEKANIIHTKQANLRDRIFGSAPTAPDSTGQNAPTPSGFLHEAKHKIKLLNNNLDKIIQQCIELERLA